MIGRLRSDVERCEAALRKLGEVRLSEEVEQKCERLKEEIDDGEAQLDNLREELEELEWPVRDLRIAEEALAAAWSKLREAEKECVS